MPTTDFVGGPEWDDADIQIQDWIEWKRKSELERLRNLYGY